jgi:hypothetical protein
VVVTAEMLPVAVNGQRPPTRESVTLAAMAEDETPQAEDTPVIYGGLPLPAGTEIVADPQGIGGIALKGDIVAAQLEKERLSRPEVREAMRAEQEAERLAGLRATRTPVSVGRLHGHLRELTVRQAASELEQRYAGEVRVENGFAIIDAPGFSTNGIGRDLHEVVEVLAAAGPAIVEAVNDRAGKVDPGKLPDRLVGAAGGLL